MNWVKRIFVFLLIVVLAATAYGIYTVRRSFPQVSGEVAVAGLDAPVEILRDELGVPHIYASSQHDLFFAQGFTHAQDRFWQMDFWRHIGAGRLAEMFGDSQVSTDRFLRTLGFESIAEQELEGLSPRSQDILAAYAEGVNAYLSDRPAAAISLEYAILPLQNSGYRIEPWSVTDTLVWSKVMSWDLGGNMGAEIARAVLGKSLGPERVEQLFPVIAPDKPVIVETDQLTAGSSSANDVPDAAIPALLSADSAVRELNALTGGGFEGIGSNNWAIGGSLTESGLPLLANDTHLAIQMPSIWYAVGLHCQDVTEDCPFSSVGFGFAGTPGVIIGHNGHHAWGVTNQAADTQDLFIEKVHPDNPRQYEVDGNWVDFDVRTETIAVAGDGDLTFEVLESRHGPVISNTYLEPEDLEGSSVVDLPDDFAVTLAWQTLEPSTIVDAIIGLNLATSYEEFVSAAALWDIAPQNLVYADVEGNIAYYPTGRIPVRASGDGRYPVPGWTSEHDWVGVVAEESKPILLNPPQGFIASANQPILRPGSEPLFSTDGALGYRADRIVRMITASDDHNVSSSQEMQFDMRDGGAEIVIPNVLSLDPAEDEVLADTQRRLEGWATGGNAFQADGRSAGAATYMGVWRHLLANTFQDELPEEYWPDGGSRWFDVMKGLLTVPDDPFWDDVSTTEVETMEDILRRSIADANTELTDLLGSDTNGWTWGELHVATFENQSLGQSGIAPIEWLFNRSAPPRVGGSTSVVDAVGWDTDKSYAVDWLPSERMVIDLADLDSSTFIHTTGQSGHAFNSQYDSMIEMWVDGEHGPMPWTRSTVETVMDVLLVLRPEG